MRESNKAKQINVLIFTTEIFQKMEMLSWMMKVMFILSQQQITRKAWP